MMVAEAVNLLPLVYDECHIKHRINGSIHLDYFKLCFMNCLTAGFGAAPC